MIATFALDVTCDHRNYGAMLNPAHSIIRLCGGYAATARLSGRSELRVRRWAYPKERGGTGGLIPHDVQLVLLENARAAGIDLRPEHFFDTSPVDPAETKRGAA